MLVPRKTARRRSIYERKVFIEKKVSARQKTILNNETNETRERIIELLLTNLQAKGPAEIGRELKETGRIKAINIDRDYVLFTIKWLGKRINARKEILSKEFADDNPHTFTEKAALQKQKYINNLVAENKKDKESIGKLRELI